MSDTITLARPHNMGTVLTPTPTSDRRRPLYVPVKNEPGRLLSIDKRLLHIDPHYQRKLNDRLVARIVSNWSWISCGVLEVSRRPGSEMYFVIDGQHRWRAACYITPIKELPCIAFELDELRDEAIGFLATNTERRMPTISDQFRALLIAGDPIAKSMERIAGTHSRVIGAPADAQHVSCVTAFARMLRDNTAAMERVFPLVAQIAAGHTLPARLLQGYHRLERCMPKGQSLSDEHWRKRATRPSYTEIMECIRQTSAIDVKGGARAYALGVLRAINKGLRNPLHASVETVPHYR